MQTFGTPSFLRWSTALSLGVSIPRSQFGSRDAIVIHFWVLNRSHKPQSFMTCEDVQYFQSRALDLYDVRGHRVFSRWETRVRNHCKTDPVSANTEWTLWVCSSDGTVPIAADSCMTGNAYPFAADLRDSYDLSPGRYTLHLHPPEARPHSICEGSSERRLTPGPNDLRIEILP